MGGRWGPEALCLHAVHTVWCCIPPIVPCTDVHPIHCPQSDVCAPGCAREVVELSHFPSPPPTPLSTVPSQGGGGGGAMELMSLRASSGLVGKLYIGDCQQACQWAGEHVDYIVNCANVDYPHHPWCIRMWLNITFKGSVDGSCWATRVNAAVRLVLEGLAGGLSVLVHCRTGKRRSGLFCALVLALLRGQSVADGIRFLTRQPVCLQGEDLQKVLDLADVLTLGFHLSRLQAEEWCAGLIEYIWELYPPMFTVVAMPRMRSRSRSHMGVRLPGRNSSASAARPLWLPSSRGGAQRRAEKGASAAVLEAAEVAATESTAASRGALSTFCGRRSSAALQNPSAARLPWRCPVHGRFIWRCQHDTDMAGWQQEAPTFEEVTRAAGIWDTDVQASGASRAAVRSLRSPTPDFPLEGLWCCTACESLNSRHRLSCARKGCEAGRPRLPPWQEGDWYCGSCGYHNFQFRRQCAWSQCPTNNWECPHCGNENYEDREVCNRHSCKHPRPGRR